MMKKNFSVLDAIIFDILILSLFAILPIVLDDIYSFVARSKYEVTPFSFASNPLEYQGHKIEIVNHPSVKLHIDDLTFDLPDQQLGHNPRLFYEDLKDVRYIQVKNKHNNDYQIAIVIEKKNPRSTTMFDRIYRIIWVSDDGIKTEDFSLFERRNPIYRAMILQYISDVPIGWVDNISYNYPTIIVPYIFPFGSFVIALLYFMLKKIL